MVTIRLSRHGSKRNPFYQITVAEQSVARDGRFIERLGFYNPVARGGEERLRLNVERADHWIAQGAQASEKVRKLLSEARKARRNAAAAGATATAE